MFGLLIVMIVHSMPRLLMLALLICCRSVLSALSDLCSVTRHPLSWGTRSGSHKPKAPLRSMPVMLTSPCCCAHDSLSSCSRCFPPFVYRFSFSHQFLFLPVHLYLLFVTFVLPICCTCPVFIGTIS